MFIYLLRKIVTLAVYTFFRRVTIENRQLIPKKGPLLVVANHPNTFMDASVIASILNEKPHFLTTASVFTNKIVKLFFRGFGLIPIVRQQDAKGERVDNEKAFANCYMELAKGKTILIFPEGTSIHERKLRKIKTGAARIALGAERQQDFQLGLQVLCIGLNYSNPRRFRSDLYIKVSAPLSVADWKRQYQIDEPAAVRALTHSIKERIESQIIRTEGGADDELLHKIEAVYKSRLLETLGWKKGDSKDNFEATKAMANALRYFRQVEPDRVVKLENEMNGYFHNLDQLALKERILKIDNKGRSIFWVGVRRLLYLTLGFPFYLFGLLNNYIPYIIPSKVAYMITKVEEYIAPIMMLTGIFSFSIFYGLQIFALQYFVGIWWLTLIYAISLPLTGFFCLQYWQKVEDSSDQWTLLGLLRQKNNLLLKLLKQREHIIEMLDAAQAEYLPSTLSEKCP